MFRISRTQLAHFALPLALIVPATASAELSQTPLYLTTSVKPNIFFLVDDSGSMDWEVLRSSGAEAIDDYASFPNSGNVDITPTITDQDEILESCVGYNVLFYDPSKTYTPWDGVDENGNAYADQSITSALMDPYDANGYTTNLTVADVNGHLPGYMTWNDDGDGVFEIGECPDPTRSGYDYANQFVATTTGSTANTSMTAAQQTNFANWYSYYRKREYVMKAALLSLVNNSSQRLGLATLHRNNSVGFPVADVSSGTNRADLMDEISQIGSSGDTPLRTTFEHVGKYFQNDVATSSSTELFGSTQGTPILSEASGGSCQQNFSVVMSDGYWNGSAPSVGNADSGSTSDGDQLDSEYDGGVYHDQNDSVSNTLADVAMHLYETDLSSLDNKVPGTPDDSNTQQHLVTYTVAFGVNGTLSANPDANETSFDWPTPVSDESTTIDDMRHAAWNGRGEFLSANDPQALLSAFSSAITSIESRTSSAATVATNSTRLDANSKIYQARFNSGEWSGQFRAYALNSVTGDVSTLQWDAADLIPATSSRNIYTSHSNTGFAFNDTSWDDGLFSTAQMSALNAVNGTTDSRGRDRINYLRGDTTYEGTDFRTRAGRLGDIVHSDPIFASDESFEYYGVAPTVSVGGVAIDSYYTYLTDATVATNKAAREPMLYVGANDGMLHAMRAEGTIGTTDAPCDPDIAACEGEEVFAYIPKALYSKLSDLTDSGYSHTYYVDGSIRVADAYIDYNDDGVSDTTRWGSVLVGLLAAGGKGVYALDISDPFNFDAKDVLWDLDDSDLTELGYTFGNASVVQLPDGTWAAIFGNGYESANYKAGLYIVNMEDPTDVVFIDTQADGSASSPNGLSSPIPVDTDNDKIADTVYAGDLYGNLWKFDLSSSNRNGWAVAYSQGSTPAPLYRACTTDDCSSPQAITSRPEVVDSSEGGVIVLFGTGSYITTDDPTSTQMQTFYGIRDDGSMVTNRSDLQAQDILAEFYVAASDADYRVTTDTAVDYTAKDGWYLDFDSSDYPGERVVSNPIVRGGRIIFPTLAPKTSPCDFGGTGWLMELDAENGSRLTVSPFDVNSDTAINASDFVSVVISDGVESVEVTVPVSGRKSTVGIVKTPAVISTGTQELKYFSGSSGAVETVRESSGDKLGRQSWLQLH
ncbi:PilC/PilY family type IV pilus protein [Pontibacterium granulatum]|uniref:pilus assembly protein n=1 Tax=Pontibacterium granulatum TaxID=2036029 RepID=UPI00249A32BB|nr:PilC/PilY family type IV pilus protein [Pontibacterium granulatum]MDI3325243.1 PilC/PilY family type IV pilus protein [Pontibacterium granulatum]